MRTFSTLSKSAAVAGLVAAAVFTGTAAASATDYQDGSVGQACAYEDGTLGLDNGQGFVIVCRNGVWDYPAEP